MIKDGISFINKNYAEEMSLSDIADYACYSKYHFCRRFKEITGTTVKSRKVFIDPEFAQQTEEIEEFVNTYARSDGSRSLRALGNQLNQRFEGFDFRHYGYDRLIDFVNAIDGVKADRYHVSPSEE